MPCIDEQQRSRESKQSMGLDLPGFRFHPTEEELLDFYLKHMVRGNKLQIEIITTINLYRYDPWELPGLAKIGEKEWYFYVHRDRRQASGGRPSRTTERGFWKATGSDRPVRSAADPKRLIGLKKTLVYYQGRAPRGSKTDWVMNEYRLPDPPPSPSANGPPKDIVLCKIYRKATSMKELEQRAAAMEEETTAITTVSPSSDSMADSWPELGDQEGLQLNCEDLTFDDVIFIEQTKQEEVAVDATAVVVEENKEGVDVAAVSTRRPSLTELEVPQRNGLEWVQDPFLTQLRSPWVADLWSPYYSSILNF